MGALYYNMNKKFSPNYLPKKMGALYYNMNKKFSPNYLPKKWGHFIIT